MLETFVLPPAGGEGATEPIKPDVHVLESAETYGKVAVEPLQRGFGLTIGNPLRRILLSSTSGSAITWVKIEDVVHEYTVIPGVKEEIMELLTALHAEGNTIIIVTHEEHIAAYCHRVVRFRDGLIEGDAPNLTARESHG